MKKAILLFILIPFMAACAPGQPFGATFTPSPTSTLTPTSTPTLTPTPTEIPIPQGLKNVPEGYSAVRNPDGSWGYGVGADAKTSVPGLTVDASGAHFRLEGTTVDIPVSEIKDRVQVGQTGALQIYDLDEYGVNRIQFAWDTKQEKWIRASDIRQPHKEWYDNYIIVQTRGQLAALFDLEPLVMSPFSPDTFAWDPTKVLVDYQNQRIQGNGEYTFWSPFGTVTDMEKSPFRFVNFILLEKGEGRKFDTYIVTEQVYNPADGTFSLLHFGLDSFEGKPPIMDRALATLFAYTEPPYILLPEYVIFSGLRYPGYEACSGVYCNQLDYFIQHNYWDAETGFITEVQRLVEVWIASGIVPEELEDLVLLKWQAHIMAPPQK